MVIAFLVGAGIPSSLMSALSTANESHLFAL
jgi:hypothetical protein